jgi:hypothetical protein
LREQPRERDLIDRRRVLGSDARDGLVLLQPHVALVAADRRIRNIGDVELLAALDEPRLEVARIEHIATVLHGGDRRRANGFIDVTGRDVREADRGDFALVAQPHELAERFCKRHGGVDRVQVVQRYRRAERRYALLAAMAQPMRAAIDFPAPFRPREPALRCDDDVGAA